MTMGALKRASNSEPRATPVKRMFGATTTMPRSGSTTPGTAMPMAVRSPGLMPPLRTMSSMHFSMAATTRSGPFFRGVGHFSRPMISPDSRTNELCTFVPPTSTPRYNRWSVIGSFFFMATSYSGLNRKWTHL